MLQNKRFQDRGQRLIPKFILLFLILQPLLDVAGYWQKAVGVMNVITLMIRMVLSAALLLLSFRVSGRKPIYYWSAGVLLLYLAGHVTACALSTGGLLDPLEDLMEQARILYLPVTALCLLSLLQSCPDALDAMKHGLTVDLAIILLTELLSLLTGSDPHTYPNQGIGILGWFLWANSQSAILSVLCPIAIGWVWIRTGGKTLPVAAASAADLGLLFFLGTRLAFAALAVSGLVMAGSIILQGKQHWRSAAAILMLTLIFTGLLPVSPMVQTRREQAENARTRQTLIDAAVSPYLTPEEAASDARRTEQPEALRAAYRFYLQGLVDRFGLERVAEQYDYSYAVSDICDRRRMQLTACAMLMEDSSGLSPWFGLELGKMRQDTTLFQFTSGTWERGTQNFDPENDFLGVYYLSGAVGLTLVTAAILCAVAALLWMLRRCPRELFRPDVTAFALAFCFCAVNAWFTLSTLRRNNASVYFAAVIAVLIHLALTRKQQKQTEP